jgi:hypothetical protein
MRITSDIQYGQNSELFDIEAGKMKLIKIVGYLGMEFVTHRKLTVFSSQRKSN